MTTSETESDFLRFELGQGVKLSEVKEIVAPNSTLDLVEETRLRMISNYATEVLRLGVNTDGRTQGLERAKPALIK